MVIVYALCLIILCIVLGVFLYCWYRIHTSICTHNAESKKTPKDYGLPFDTRYITTSDGLKLATWFIPVKNPKAIVILVHGYAPLDGGRPLMLYNAEFLHHAGYTSLMVNLRATGESEGSKSTFGITEWKDVQAAYEYVQSLPESKDKKIILFGGSMGAATVINTAGKLQIGDIVVAAVPYASLASLYRFRLQQEKLPRFLLPFVLLAAVFELGKSSIHFNPEHFITKIHKPIFLISATHDETVNSQDAIQLFEKAHNPKSLWEADSRHLVDKDQPEELKKRVLGFLEKYV